MLTTVDYATRYSEAVSLKKNEAKHVTEALMDVFCSVGIPKQVLSDRNLTSYNPKCNGLRERGNGLLKNTVK